MLIDTRGDAPSPAPSPAEDLIDPSTGEILPRDIDSLVSAFERVSGSIDEMVLFKKQIIRALVAKTTGEGKIRRVRGDLRQVKITMPDHYYTQSILKEAWNSYPKFRNEFLRIDSVAIRKREFKKLQKTAGQPDLENFKKMIESADVGPSGTPRVEIDDPVNRSNANVQTRIEGAKQAPDGA